MNDILSSNIWDFNKKDDNEEFNEKMKTLMDRKDNKLVNYGTKEWNVKKFNIVFSIYS